MSLLDRFDAVNSAATDFISAKRETVLVLSISV